MTGWVFWIVAALMTGGAVALLLHRLFAAGASVASGADAAIYRDQLRELERERATGEIGAAEAEAAKAEIARRLLAAAGEAPPAAVAPALPPRRVALGLAVLLPVAALAIYMVEGTPGLPSQPFASRDPGERMAAQSAVAEARALEQRLAASPQDRAGWIELGQRWSQLGESAKAADAYGRAIGLGNADAELTGRYGEALVGANGSTVTETARAAFEQALQLKPGDIRARYFLALGNAQAGDDRAALDLWQALARESPADAPWLPSVRQHLAEAAQRLGLDPKSATPEPQPPVARAAPPANGPAAGIASLPPDEQAKAIRGMVDGLAARLEQSPDDLEGWVRLARARGVLGDVGAAADAYARAAALAPDNNDLLRAYADSLLAAGRGEEVPPLLETGLRRILAADPNDAIALWFLGVAAQKSGQPEEARRLWGRMRDQFQEGSQERRAIEGRISQLPAPGAG
ncbi:c-type cytochrome biogenesis protein CcmI [Mycobacterium sp. KBS0706]|uniref:c-type cytochrome biogenesis protein CcmI n=1 Tax=Mycobacterium sp. KBS0706 TaxID=2578109 RepID=UPI00110FB4D4|nr:c-type cytochrome biogenesis protein CcmI [Mycobacterium sp. KBS0706]TSD90122.1 c-type cytochrome biogenesis protein CcmI [Mycobacterium sp. KBS0706]